MHHYCTALGQRDRECLEPLLNPPYRRVLLNTLRNILQPLRALSYVALSSGADTNEPVSLSPNTWLTCEAWLAYAGLMQN